MTIARDAAPRFRRGRARGAVGSKLSVALLKDSRCHPHLEVELMANIESSSVDYCLECSSCGHEWYESVETSLGNCPSCGSAVEKSSGHFRLADAVEASVPSDRRSSGCWGWAEATQNKP